VSSSNKVESRERKKLPDLANFSCLGPQKEERRKKEKKRKRKKKKGEKREKGGKKKKGKGNGKEKRKEKGERKGKRIEEQQKSPLQRQINPKDREACKSLLISLLCTLHVISQTGKF